MRMKLFIAMVLFIVTLVGISYAERATWDQYYVAADEMNRVDGK